MHLSHFHYFGGGCLGLLLLAFTIVALVNILASRASVGAKVLWIILIWVFPCGGPLLWFFVGPRQRDY
jgi:hypothetical protein